MSNEPLHRLVADYLRAHRGERLTADAIAKGLIGIHPKRFAEKGRALGDERLLLDQLTREIYAQKKRITSQHLDVITDTSRRPLRFFVEDQGAEQALEISPPSGDAQVVRVTASRRLAADASSAHALPSADSEIERREHDLYPILQKFLFSELNIVSKRIRESTSSNRRGRYGNKWLHPDIVSLYAPGHNWGDLIRDCASALPTRKAKLVAIEVKLRLSSGDVREAFFQSVSNSLWANRAYLASTEVKGEDTLDELNTLCSLHGVGYISIDPENFTESRIVIPAREREEVDWASANRIATENSDFRDYIRNVLNFLQTGHVMSRLWEHTADS